MRHKSIGHWILRHDDDHEVQPVPRVSEEGEPANTEASRHHFHEDLQHVDNREHDSVHEGRKKEESNERKLTQGKFKMCSWRLSTEVLCTNFFLQKFLVLAFRLQILGFFFSVSWEMSDTAGSTPFKSISLFCLTWVKNICFPFLGTESPSQSSYRLNLSGSLSAVDENVNFSEWGQMASLSPSCLNFKRSNLTQFYAVTHFLATSSQRRSSLFTTLFCVCCCQCAVCVGATEFNPNEEWVALTQKDTHSKGMCQDWVSFGYARHTAMKTQLTRTVNRIRELNKVSMSRKHSGLHYNSFS